MLIALDYDLTYTADPEFWELVVRVGLSRGHRFICVTGRRDSDPVPPLPMPVVYAGDVLKSRAAARAGYVPDVWIDDMPGTIEPVRVLEWDECVSDAAKAASARDAAHETRRRHPWFLQCDGLQNPREFHWLLRDGSSAVRLFDSDESVRREWSSRLQPTGSATEDPSDG